MSPLASKQSEYDGYYSEKGWDRVDSSDSFPYWDQLVSRFKLTKGASVLEIGFGAGGFLDWCKHRKISTTGVEILDPALENAAAHGHKVFPGPFSSTTLDPSQKFDTIALFDVLEHMTIQEIKQLFSDTLPHLKDDGNYILRFPNGTSPFVGWIHTGDITHRTLLSPHTVDKLAKPYGIVVADIFNDRTLPSGFVAAVRRRLAYAIRDHLEIVIGYAYYGRRMPMDPNVFLILTKRR
jgi:cyclopropane fatty-acyl-phospholipid synthase-like methyltransferase